MQSNGEQSLPVFVFPAQLVFYLKDVNTHRHLITIYNPYDFVLCFQVLCTTPSNYSVMEPQGVIKPRCCVDIAIRRLNLHGGGSSLPGASIGPPTPKPDKFRIYVKRRDKAEVCGFRDVTAELFVDRRQRDRYPSSPGAGRPAGSDAFDVSSCPSTFPGGDSGNFERDTSAASATAAEFRSWPLEQRSADSSASVRHYPMPGGDSSSNGRSSWLLIAVAGICVACLSAPGPDSEFLKNVQLPEWIALTATQKLVAAYVLGLVTSALLLQH